MVTITEINEILPLSILNRIEAMGDKVQEFYDFITENRKEIIEAQKLVKGSKFNHTALKNKLDNTLDKMVEDNIDYLILKVDETDYSQLVDHTTKEGDLIKIMSDLQLGLFTRRSDGKQSSYEVEDIINSLSQDGTVMFSEDSSSFKDLAFLRFLQYCIENNIRNVKVFSRTRTPIETVTRSYENALRINAFIDKNFQHFDKIMVQGINLVDQMQRAVFLLQVSTLEGKWLMTANTKYYFKHEIYLRVLEGINEIEDIPTLALEKPKNAPPTIKEFKAFYHYNQRDMNEFKAFLNYLKNKHK